MPAVFGHSGKLALACSENLVFTDELRKGRVRTWLCAGAQFVSRRVDVSTCTSSIFFFFLLLLFSEFCTLPATLIKTNKKKSQLSCALTFKISSFRPKTLAFFC